MINFGFITSWILFSNGHFSESDWFLHPAKGIFMRYVMYYVQFSLFLLLFFIYTKNISIVIIWNVFRVVIETLLFRFKFRAKINFLIRISGV